MTQTTTKLCVHGGVWISFGNLAVRWDKVIPTSVGRSMTQTGKSSH